jgi:hypothetical protein
MTPMTIATIVFYISSVALGYERFKQLGRPYPALRSFGIFTAGLVVFAIMHALQ